MGRLPGLFFRCEPAVRFREGKPWNFRIPGSPEAIRISWGSHVRHGQLPAWVDIAYQLWHCYPPVLTNVRWDIPGWENRSDLGRFRWVKGNGTLWVFPNIAGWKMGAPDWRYISYFELVIFQCYVSLLEGISKNVFMIDRIENIHTPCKELKTVTKKGGI